MPDEAKPVKPRMQLFHADGAPLDSEMMYPEGLEGSVLAGFARAEEAGMHDGHRLRCLYRSPLPDGPSLCHMWLKSGFITPRHKHDTNCIYYVLAGELKLGNASAGPGEGVFVPEGTVYSIEAGPQGLEVLEFRTDTKFNVFYTGNDEANWDRIVGAVAGNVADWASQPPPSKLEKAR
jgi:hypothetical protein